MEFSLEDTLKILAAVIAGGLIGAEREFRDKAAGFRTIIFICLGSTLFTLFSLKLGGTEDPARIAAGVVSGIGFLGAGAILREGFRVRGLTTAAAIWLAAALGMGIGGGYYTLVFVTVAAALVILWYFPDLEHRLDHLSEARTYEIVCKGGLDKLRELESRFKESGLEWQPSRTAKKGDRLDCAWEARGPATCHEKLTESLLTDAEVQEVRF